jgi:hypothetical protein
MTKIVLDKRTRDQLRDLKEPLEFVDESGHSLGLFTPNVDPKRLQPQISADEIAARLAKGGGRPLAEILGDLEKGS